MKNLLLLLTMLFLISCTENEDLFNKQNRVSTSEYFDKRLISRSTSNISKNDAENIANIFFSPSITKAQPSNISIKEVICIKDKEDEPAFYILNYLSNNGFIIVSATKNYPPILAYSSSDNISLKTNTAARLMIDEYIGNIESINSGTIDSLRNKYAIEWSIFEEKDPITKSATQLALSVNYNKDEEKIKWQQQGYECHDISAINYFLTPEEAQKFIQDICSHSDPNVNCMDASILLIKRSNSKYGPLINTNWNQSALPFNIDASNGHAGCGPIAAAQIMKFHQWPNTYNWTQIGLNPSSDNSSAQKMITDVRNACDAKYNDEGTSTTISNVSSALDKNFNYSTSIYNYYGFSERLKTAREIQANRPVFMRGTNISSNEGHAWVCEGYEENITLYAAVYISNEFGLGEYEYYSGVRKTNSEYFYMNWGWGAGAGNGWFYSDMVSPNSYNFSKDRKVLTINPRK
ncbi:MAG: C10 family peptidase [Parabacteroides sp.]|jgi:hypothetical protein|uniref:Spi protease inhibitor domain-containing protein n=1 Tax=Macellibacteroides fermentans TaxID=879969 RepID=A0A8E2D618_9PORP|nr:C10 family peptidase [Macellibacteroides fermentans]MBP7919840.1 C10 family peptidase [Parabacteroides sp.]OCW92438.1 hypothetical protein A9168_16080 [Macellibacteroides sp. HH-ZS]HAD01498.1 hypothetical protein [Porphyromonadaceae bacterium]MDD3255754.1 C10 family peptidase [Parabacteroides sp.]MDD3509486.1 C10 family peptidase [Parabacteroides sp.]